MEDRRDELIERYSRPTDREGLLDRFKATVRMKRIFILALMVVIFITALVSITLGSSGITIIDALKTLMNAIVPVFDDIPASFKAIVINTRLPRIVMAILTGAALAIAGCVMQGLLRNPLVSPFTLGVSNAAAFGVGLSILFGATVFGGLYGHKFNLLGQVFSGGSIIQILFAFAFGLLSIAFVLVLANREHVSKSTLVLSGVVMSYLFQAGLSFMKYVSDDSSLRDITLWIMGNLWNCSWGIIIVVLPIVVICAIYLERISIDINALSAGTEVAKNLGVDVSKLRVRGLLVCTILACTCLAFTGAIGFIGLMAPHICRKIMGNDNRYLLPASALMGSLILLISDTIARTAFSTDLPVGILIYIIGGIFFIYMVFKREWRNSA